MARELRSRHSDLSIRRWLSLLCIGTATLVLTVTTAGFIVMESGDSRHEARREVSMLAEMLDAHAAGAVAFGDEVVAGETVQSLRANARVQLGCLYDIEGVEIARYSALPGSSGRPCPEVAAQGVRFDGNTVLITRVMKLGDDLVGLIHLESKMESLSSRIARKAIVGVPLLLGAALLALLFASRVQRRITHPIRALVDGANSLSRGDLAAPPDVSGVEEVAALSEAFGVMAGSLRTVVGHTQRTTADVAETVSLLRSSSGRLSADARNQATAVTESAQSLQEIGSSSRSVSDSAEILAQVARDTEGSRTSIDVAVREVVGHANQLFDVVDGTAVSITQMKSSIGDIAGSLTELNDSAEKTVRSVQQLHESVGSVAEFASGCDELVSRTAQEVEAGQRVVSETLDETRLLRESFVDIQEGVAALSDQSDAIDRFVQIIGDVADEANLLSLNARVIAAQAGDSGRSFSVVADQMRTLATRTATSTREIRTLVQSFQECTRGTVDLVAAGSEQMNRGVGKWEQAGDALCAIGAMANESAELASQIAEATRIQGAELDHVGEDASRVMTMTHKIANATDEQRQASGGIEETAQRLRNLANSLQGITVGQGVESQRIASSRLQIEAIAEATNAQGAHREQLERALDTFRKGAIISAEQAERLEKIVADLAVRSAEAQEAVTRFRL